MWLQSNVEHAFTLISSNCGTEKTSLAYDVHILPFASATLSSLYFFALTFLLLQN